jgi:hypothetical protein
LILNLAHPVLLFLQLIILPLNLFGLRVDKITELLNLSCQLQTRWCRLSAWSRLCSHCRCAARRASRGIFISSTACTGHRWRHDEAKGYDARRKYSHSFLLEMNCRIISATNRALLELLPATRLS